MPCSRCQKLAKIKGSNLYECTEHHWQFSPELAQKQRLCDNKTNYTPPITPTEGETIF